MKFLFTTVFRQKVSFLPSFLPCLLPTLLPTTPSMQARTHGTWEKYKNYVLSLRDQVFSRLLPRRSRELDKICPTMRYSCVQRRYATHSPPAANEKRNILVSCSFHERRKRVIQREREMLKLIEFIRINLHDNRTEDFSAKKICHAKSIDSSLVL